MYLLTRLFTVGVSMGIIKVATRVIQITSAGIPNGRLEGPTGRHLSIRLYDDMPSNSTMVEDFNDDDDFRQIEQTVPKRTVGDRWTSSLTDRGFTAVSNVFLELYSSLNPKITHGEAMFIIHLMQHKWDDKAPYPSIGRIAKRMGISPTATRALARSLEKKGYLHREGQPGRSNRYHFVKLFRALEQPQT